MTKTASQKRRAREARKNTMISRSNSARSTNATSLLSMRRPFEVGIRRPPPYLRAHEDVVHARFGGVFGAVDRSVGLANYLLMLSPANTSSSGYVAFGNFISGFERYGGIYSRYMIGDLQIKVRCVSAITAGGYAVVNYEADSSGTSSPPTTIADVANAVHKVTATPAVGANFSVPVHTYFNDWKNCTLDATGASSSEQECGTIQVFAANVGAVGDPVVLVEVEFDAWFTGYRKLV